jgi:hypothetical protein
VSFCEGDLRTSRHHGPAKTTFPNFLTVPRFGNDAGCIAEGNTIPFHCLMAIKPTGGRRERMRA